ncbi:hypothetical protein KM043_011031 [Ampulex compressa]|nr:hypothetical protein KM043_011031 [Ampulex compressa]
MEKGRIAFLSKLRRRYRISRVSRGIAKERRSAVIFRRSYATLISSGREAKRGEKKCGKREKGRKEEDEELVEQSVKV